MLGLKLLNKFLPKQRVVTRCLATNPINNNSSNSDKKFETVFSFPFIKYFAVFNRLKVYHLFGTASILPVSGLLEIGGAVPQNTFLTATYIGVTAAALFCTASIPFKNIIGFIYISKDNKEIKISYLDYWGKRRERIIATEDWIPMMDLPPRTLDAIYHKPQLADGSKYVLFIKFGKIHNSNKIGEVLE